MKIFITSKNMLLLSVILASSTIFINLGNYNYRAIAAEPDFVTLEQTTNQHSTTVTMIVPSSIPSEVPVDVILGFANQNNNGENVTPLTDLGYDFRVIQNGNATYQQTGSAAHDPSHANEGAEAVVTPTFVRGPATVIVILNPPPSSASNETAVNNVSSSTADTDSASFNIEVS
jgi:hypothetical protein